MGRENLRKFTGSLNPISGSVSALAFSYTFLENLALVAYMCEGGTLGDDMTFALQGKLHLSRILKEMIDIEEAFLASVSLICTMLKFKVLIMSNSNNPSEYSSKCCGDIWSLA